MVYKFFDKKTGSGASVNELIAQELHKSVMEKFKKGNSIPSSKIIFGLHN